jgi:hypothetical protein
MTAFSESAVEEAALVRLGALGYAVERGSEIVVDEPMVERGDPGYRDVVAKRPLHGVLRPKVAFWESLARTAGNLSEMPT